MSTTLLQVMIGGGLGAGLRWLMSLAILRVVGTGFPLGILSVNVLGSILMGIFVAAAAARGLTHLSPLVQTGLLGGFTTFSSFSLEAALLIERGAMGTAAAYILLSVGLSIAGLFAGMIITRGVLS